MSSGRRVQLTDSESRALIARIRSGELNAFRTVYLTFYTPLLEFAHSYTKNITDAEDIVQDVFATWWQQREQASITSGLDPYLYGAVRNRALHYLRQERTRNRDDITTHLASDTWSGTVIQTDSSVLLEQKEAETYLASVINTLPELRRAALTLRIRHDLPYSAIATTLGISESAAMIHVSRARATLKQLFDNKFCGT